MKVKVKYAKNRGGRVTMMEIGYAKLLTKLGVVSYVDEALPPAPAPKPKTKTTAVKKKATGEKKAKKPRASRKKKSDALPIDAR